MLSLLIKTSEGCSLVHNNNSSQDCCKENHRVSTKHEFDRCDFGPVKEVRVSDVPDTLPGPVVSAGPCGLQCMQALLAQSCHLSATLLG